MPTHGILTQFTTMKLLYSPLVNSHFTNKVKKILKIGNIYILVL
jgi:hypothetical protein